MTDRELWDGCFSASCYCCGDDVNFPINSRGECHDGAEGKCDGCGRVYAFGVEEGDDGEGVGYMREIEDEDERPRCSCPDEEFKR